MTRDSGDSVRGRFVADLVTLSPYPTPLATFVANKGLTAIRPDGDRAVEASFSASFGLESRRFFSPHLKCHCYRLINRAEPGTLTPLPARTRGFVPFEFSKS